MLSLEMKGSLFKDFDVVTTEDGNDLFSRNLVLNRVLRCRPGRRGNSPHSRKVRYANQRFLRNLESLFPCRL